MFNSYRHWHLGIPASKEPEYEFVREIVVDSVEHMLIQKNKNPFSTYIMKDDCLREHALYVSTLLNHTVTTPSVQTSSKESEAKLVQAMKDGVKFVSGQPEVALQLTVPIFDCFDPTKPCKSYVDTIDITNMDSPCPSTMNFSKSNYFLTMSPIQIKNEGGTKTYSVSIACAFDECSLNKYILISGETDPIYP